MNKTHKQKKSLKLKNLKKRKTIKQRGGSRRKPVMSTHSLLESLPSAPTNEPINYPNVPLADPKFKKLNDDCYNAKQNLKNLEILLEKEKQDIIEGKKKDAELCKYFNTYITALKKQPFYNAIYLETFGPDVPV